MSSSSARGVTTPSAGQSSSSSSGRQFGPEVGLNKPSRACPLHVALQAGLSGGRGEGLGKGFLLSDAVMLLRGTTACP